MCSYREIGNNRAKCSVSCFKVKLENSESGERDLLLNLSSMERKTKDIANKMTDLNVQLELHNTKLSVSNINY